MLLTETEAKATTCHKMIGTTMLGPRLICHMLERGNSIAQDRANARLIAAAPDLLAIARRWVALDGGAWHADRHAREKADLIAETRAAVAKATGGGNG